MNRIKDINITHSNRRPTSEAWCAASGGRTTYAGSREEALSRHKRALEAYGMMTGALKLCAEYSSCSKN